jgi:signal transduction histidine kinase
LNEPNAAVSPYQIRILRPLAAYLRDVHGARTLEEAAASAGLTAADFEGSTRWVTIQQFESFVAATREQCATDDEFRRACVHRLAESYGPLRFVLWAASPLTVYRLSVATYHIVSTNGRAQVLSHGATSLNIRLTGAETSRLTCIMRQEQTGALPTLWGQPPATLREDACIARGDAHCDFHFRWYPTRSWLPIALGFALGGALAFVLGPTARWAVAFLGGAVGYIWEQRRIEIGNRARREEMVEALRLVGEEEAAARREILDLHTREKEWNRVLEREVAERSAKLADIAKRVDSLQEERTSKLLGFSHDLKNPLHIIRMSIDYMRENSSEFGADGVDVVRDLDHSVTSMQRMLTDLMQVVTAEHAFKPRPTERMEVPPMVERLRRRLAALVQGKDIRVSVFASREAPDAIVADTLVFDRVIDNLLSNAAKYTERGSIIVEIDGTPGMLVLKVSDTGRGIADDEMERTFRAGGSDPKTRGKESWGVGLSVVVQLLDQVGGRLEVMSKPGKGTTFWVHLPVNPTVDRPGEVRQIEGDPLSRVVKIRKRQA